LGDDIVPLGAASFQPTGPTGLPVTINGCFLLSTITFTPEWILASYFDAPKILTDVLSGFDLLSELVQPNSMNLGFICGEC
jgi:hypothetical protein